MEKDKRLMETSWWERLRGNLGLVLMGRAMLSKSLIQFSVGGWGCVPSLLLTWGLTMVETYLVAQMVKHLPTMWETQVRFLGWEDLLEKETATHSIPLTQSTGSQRVGHDWVTSLNYGGGKEDNSDLLLKVTCTTCYSQCPQPCSRPPLTHASTGGSWTLRGNSGSVSCGVTAPFSWVLVHIRFVWALWASLEVMRFDSKHDFALSTILLGFLCPWTWGYLLTVTPAPCNCCSSAEQLLLLKQWNKWFV